MVGLEAISLFIGLAVAGLFIGVCSGLLGIGGGTVMIPLLRLVFGIDAYAAAGTSLFTMVFTSISGATSHVRNKTCYPALGIALGLGGAIASPVGVHLGNASPAWAIMLVAALIIFYSAYSMLSKALKLPKGEPAREATKPRDAKAVQAAAPTAAFEDGNSEPAPGKPAETSQTPLSRVQPEPASGTCANPSSTAEDGFSPNHKTLTQGLLIGAIAGLCAGYVGVGGGFIMVPLMTAWLGVPMKKASGTSAVAIIILAIPGVIGQIMLGHVDYLAGIMMAAGSIPGAAIGARLVKAVNERQLRFLFAGFLLVAGILLVGNELSVLG